MTLEKVTHHQLQIYSDRGVLSAQQLLVTPLNHQYHCCLVESIESHTN